MSQGPRVNVVVVNRNGSRYLEKCLGTILDQSYHNFEVTLVDNGSTDGSTNLVRTRFPQVKLIELPTNQGFAVGNNIGFKNDPADFVITLNNDAWVQRDFLEVLVREAEANPIVASVGCKIVQVGDGSIRYGPVYIDRRLFIYKSPYLLSEPDPREYTRKSRVAANCACAALYRGAALNRVGFFDNDFISNFEDHDLGYRLNLAGYSCIYTPETTVFHVGGASEGSMLRAPPGRTRLIVRNQLFTYFKNYEGRNLLKVLPVTIVALGSWTVVLWLQRRSSSRIPLSLTASFVQGLLDFVRVLPRAIASRRAVQKLRTVPDKEIFRKTSLNNFDFYRSHRERGAKAP